MHNNDWMFWTALVLAGVWFGYVWGQGGQYRSKGGW